MLVLALFAACKKDAEHDPVAMKITEVSVTPYYKEARFVAKCDYPGRWESALELSATSDMASPKHYEGTKEGKTIIVVADGLTPNTRYYGRLTVSNSYTSAQSEVLEFTTIDKPVVSTAAVTDITGNTATGGGTVSSDNGAAVTERGICWSTGHNPTTNGSHATGGTGPGNFTCNMTGLTANTTYYVRAYAKNSVGTAYGEEVSFTTTSVPTVTTSAITDIASTTAKGGGNVTFEGNTSVTERGICWDTNHNPTLRDAHLASGSGLGNFTVQMPSLTANTTYYVRAYATNSAGTVYGNEVSFTTLSDGDSSVPTGALPGRFTINASGDQVYFSQGNLQYQASTDTWRFAEHQWDYVGNDNQNISSTYSGWIDLFGWGTSGYNHGATCYQPWSTSYSYSNYYAYGSDSNNLYDETGKADWGYNRISNGGNTENQWRTLTGGGNGEWYYLFNTRSTASGIRYAKAKVNGVNGVILVPDGWSTSTYVLNSTNMDNADYTTNTISQSEWTGVLEPAGCVFLPAAGRRHDTSVYNADYFGYYWSSSYGSISNAYYVIFYDGYLGWSYDFRVDGRSVRLVRRVQ